MRIGVLILCAVTAGCQSSQRINVPTPSTHTELGIMTATRPLSEETSKWLIRDRSTTFTIRYSIAENCDVQIISEEGSRKVPPSVFFDLTTEEEPIYDNERAFELLTGHEEPLSSRQFKKRRNQLDSLGPWPMMKTITTRNGYLVCIFDREGTFVSASFGSKNIDLEDIKLEIFTYSWEGSLARSK